jgi:hypothetical protein
VAALQYLVEEARHRLEPNVDFRISGKRADWMRWSRPFFRVAQDNNVARMGVFDAQLDLEFKENQLILQVTDHEPI